MMIDLNQLLDVSVSSLARKARTSSETGMMLNFYWTMILTWGQMQDKPKTPEKVHSEAAEAG